MKKKTGFALLFFLLLGTAPALAEEPGYWRAIGRNLWRGTKNILSSPAEIPITMQEYHERSGYPVVRQLTGFADGLFQMIERAGSGAWDYLVALIPGAQEGLPPTPETLF